MADFEYDIHTHTTTSDGKLPWKGLLAYAKEEGLKGISITDHNTIGPIDEIRQEATRLGLRYISGTEIKTTCQKQINEYQAKNKSSSILLPTQELIIYGINPDNPEFREMTRKHLEGKKEYLHELSRLLRNHRTTEIPGTSVDHIIDIDADEIIREAGNYVGATNVLEAIIKKYSPADGEKLSKKDVKKLVVDAQADALKIMQDDPFYGLDMIEGLRKAKSWGKFISMAHPYTESRREMSEFYEQFLMPRLAESGLDALEFSYPEHTFEQMKHIERMAKKFGLWITGGSDFHRKEDELYRLGCAGVDKATFDMIEEKTA